MQRPSLGIMIGNIGSGKTTFLKEFCKLCSDVIVVSRDSLRYMLGAGEYKFDVKLEVAVWKSELEILKQFMKLKQDIIVDEVGVSRKMRKRYIDLAKKYRYEVTALVMPRANMQICVDRRMNCNHGNTDRETWESIWKKFDNLYEVPTTKEGIHHIVNI